MERQARPAIVDVRSVSNDSATGAQLFIDGAAVGTLPAKVEVAAGKHLIEVKKANFKDYRDSVDVAEGDNRTMVIELQPEAKKGSVLVTSDVAGADVYVDGVRKDAAPALIGDLIEGTHTIEVRKDPLPPFKTVVQVVGNQQSKVDARIQAAVPQTGSLRVVSSTPGAEVLVDGEAKGPVNAEIGNLRPGQHIVEVRAKGFTPQVVEQAVVAGEQRIAKIDLQALEVRAQQTHLRIVTPQPDVEVFIDGASVGKAPVERNDLAPGRHFVVARKTGFAEWKREINLDPAAPTTLTAELSASGILKVLSNVGGADVFIDGMVVGKTPLTLDNVQAGEHLVEVKAKGYVEAKQPFHLDGGEQKILSADLTALRSGLGPADVARVYRSMSSFSAVTVEPNKFTADIYGGFFPFGGVSLTVGAFRKGMFGVDAGVEGRTVGYLTEGVAHVKFQFFRGGPAALGAAVGIGGGGGPDGRNDFVFELGPLFTLLFGDLVRFTAHGYMQVYSDRLCRDKTVSDEPHGCTLGTAGFDPHSRRFDGFRLFLRAALEISVSPIANIFFIFEGDPIGFRDAYTPDFAPAFSALTKDPQVYGRMGVTFKF